MALTLADYSARADTPLQQGVIDVMRKVSPFVDMLPIQSVGSLTIENYRDKAMPTIGWRKIGEDHGTSKAVYEPVTEQAYSFGDYIDVDKVLVKNKASLIDNRAYQTKKAVESMTHEFLDKIINGSPAVDEDSIVGLWYRLVNDLPSAQSIAAAASGLDISPDASSLSTNQNTMLDALDEFLDALEGGTADVVLMNDTCLRRINSALRQKGLLASDKDSFGRKITRYGEGGPLLLDVGRKSDQSTRIIGNVEAADGSALTGGASTSLYAVKFGVEMFTGWEMYPLDVEDMGKLEDGVTYRTIVDWVVGLSIINPRAVARLHGVIAA